MKRTLTAVALALTCLSAPAFADGSALDSAVKDKLTAQLVAQGYDVRKIEAEDGLIEAYVVKDGATLQLWFDADLKPVEHGNEAD
jgi:hypothetical protein